MSASDVRDLVPPGTARAHRLMPMALRGECLEVGFEREPDPQVLQDLAFLTGRQVVSVSVRREEIEAYLDEIGPPKDEAVEHRAPALAGEAAPEGAGTLILEGPAPQIVDRTLREAITRGASDIHFEPHEDIFRVRYRLDGVLHVVGTLPLRQKSAVVARLKVMAELDIAEKRRPQDGRITLKRKEGDIDLRVSTLPTAFGEKVVLRILDRSGVNLDLGALGFCSGERETFGAALEKPHGMILVTGPTGSGKTTTLYAALNILCRPAVNIQTIEDPIEYHLPGVNQAQVKAEIGFTFAEALRAFLRQDPDVIMVGEIRDRETAEIAVRAALTGHLVLSTLHTNDAPGAAGRLLDMGVPSYLVASSLSLVAAQRLVRTVCPACEEEHAVETPEREALELPSSVGTCKQGVGCPECSGTGYRGRTAVFELLPVTETLAELIAQRASTYALRDRARAEGMTTLREAAAHHVAEGVTTPAEALRQTAL